MGPLGRDTLSQTLHRRFPTYLQIWRRLYALLKADANNELYAYLYDNLQQCGLAVQSLEYDNLGLLLRGEPRSGANHSLFIYTDYHQQELTYHYAATIMACLAAFDSYSCRQKSLPVTIYWLLGNKRVSSAHTFQQFALNQPALFHASGCLWFHREALTETTENAQLALGAKGLLSVDCRIETGQTDLPSHYGTIVQNAAWRLLWALGSLKNQHEDILIQDFYDRTLPYEDNILAALRERPEPISFQNKPQPPAHLLPGLQNEQVSYAHYLTPTCTINIFRSGPAGTHKKEADYPLQLVVPAQANAQLDFHLVPNQDPQEIFTQLQQHLNQQGFADVSAQILYACAPAFTPLHHPFVQAIHQATTQAYEQVPLLLPVIARHLPLAAFRQRSTPVVVVIPPAVSRMQSADLMRLIKQIVLSIEGLENLP